MPTLDSDLVVSSLGNVSDPTIRVISGLVIDTQKSHMHSTGREHGHLKFGIDWWSTPRLGSNGRHKIYVGLNVTLGLSRETFYSPYNRLLFWFIFGTSEGMLDFCLSSIFRHWNLDYYMSSKELIRKIGNNLEIDRDPVT
jgi:hypothetical protein